MHNTTIPSKNFESDIPWDDIEGIIGDIVDIITSSVAKDKQKEAELIGNLLKGAIAALKTYFETPSPATFSLASLTHNVTEAATDIPWATIQDLFQRMLNLIIKYAPDDKKKILGLVRDVLNGLLEATKNYFDPGAHVDPLKIEG